MVGWPSPAAVAPSPLALVPCPRHRLFHVPVNAACLCDSRSSCPERACACPCATSALRHRQLSDRECRILTLPSRKQTSLRTSMLRSVGASRRLLWQEMHRPECRLSDEPPALTRIAKRGACSPAASSGALQCPCLCSDQDAAASVRGRRARASRRPHQPGRCPAVPGRCPCADEGWAADGRGCPAV